MIVTKGLGSNLIITQGYGSLAPYTPSVMLREYIRQIIMDDVIATLRTIKVVNGYKTNAGANISKKFLTPSLVMRYPHLSVCDGDEYTEYGVDHIIESVFSIKIYGVVEDHADPHKESNKVIGDIKDALLADQERGDWANNTMVTDISQDESLLVSYDKSFFELNCLVEYTHKITQP